MSDKTDHKSEPEYGIFQIDGVDFVRTGDGLVYKLVPNVSVPDITSD